MNSDSFSTEMALRKMRRIRRTVPLLLPTLAVVIFGASRVGDTSLWMDETFSAQAVQYPPSQFLEFISSEAGMGPWYLCLWLWARLTSFSGEWLRLWSVIGAALSVALFQLVLKRQMRSTGSDRHWIGLGVILLFCHPSFLLAMTEARAYSWMVAGAVGSLLLLERLKELPSSRRLLALTLCVGISAALHPVSLYFQGCVLMIGLVFARPKLPKWQLATSSMAAASLALPFYLVTLRSGANQTSWIGPLTLERVARALTNYLGGVPGAFVTAPLLLVALLKVVRSHKPKTRKFAELIDHFQTEILIGVPIGLLFAQSFVVNGFSGRYLTPLVPVLAIAVLNGCRALTICLEPRWHRTGFVLISLIAIFALPQDLLFREPNRGSDFRGLAEHLQQFDWTNRQIVVPDPTLAQGVWFYASDDLRRAFYPQPDSDPRPWDKFEHALPVSRPAACSVIILDPRSDTELFEVLTVYFDADWRDQVGLGVMMAKDGFRYTEISNSNC